jgi:hypothetical protein
METFRKLAERRIAVLEERERERLIAAEERAARSRGGQAAADAVRQRTPELVSEITEMVKETT